MKNDIKLTNEQINMNVTRPKRRIVKYRKPYINNETNLLVLKNLYNEKYITIIDSDGKTKHGIINNINVTQRLPEYMKEYAYGYIRDLSSSTPKYANACTELEIKIQIYN